MAVDGGGMTILPETGGMMTFDGGFLLLLST
jgi:hypothetical protein